MSGFVRLRRRDKTGRSVPLCLLPALLLLGSLAGLLLGLADGDLHTVITLGQERETGDFDSDQPLLQQALPPAVEASPTYTTWLPLLDKELLTRQGPHFGVQIYNTSTSMVTRTLDVGAGWIRLQLWWAWVEPNNTLPEHYLWPTWLDQGLAELGSRGLNIVMTIHGNPSWAATYPGGSIDLVDTREFVEFAVAAVKHYSAPPYNVRYWEFYNEPDNGSEFWADYGWGYWGNEPAAYADLLAATYQPIKQANPDVQVLFGGLAYDYWAVDDGPFVQEFLDGVLANGGGAYFDILNFHYYPTRFRSRWDPYGPGLVGKSNFLRGKLAEYGLQKPLICTEVGVETKVEGELEVQARYIVQVLAQGKGAGLISTIWFMLVDEAGLGYWKSGLLTDQMQPKPGYFAFQTAVDQMAHAQYVRTVPATETGTPQLEVHEFLALDGATRMLVVWSNDGLSYPLAVPAAALLVVDKFGAESIVRDGDDGLLDGVVHLSVGPSPVYLRSKQTQW